MSAFGAIRSSLLGLATNLRGWRTRRKLLVIESDDWGAVRMPSKRAWSSLLKAGIRVDQSAFDTVDCLEKREDLDLLFNELDRHVDANQRRPVFTSNMVLANPDFDAIRESGFEQYSHRDLWRSYEHYNGESNKDCWSQAITGGYVLPQFHAYEHLNVPLWMRDLYEGRSATRIAFDHDFFGLTSRTSSNDQRNYLAAYWAESESDLKLVLKRLDQGLAEFKKAFGRASKTFVACNYILPRQAESTLFQAGVRSIQSQRGQFSPSGVDASGKVLRTFTGKIYPSGVLRTVRNVLFEPFLGGSKDWVSASLRQISSSFLLGKPAVISTHRANYVSGLSTSNRDNNLRKISDLLEQVLKTWPEVEFISSEELYELIVKNQRLAP